MLRLLIVDHKRDRMMISKQCLEMFLRRFITVDKTWIHYFTSETKDQSKQWISPDEAAPKKVETVKSAGKVATVFWDAHGIIHINYLPSKQTIDGDYYAVLLVRFNNILKKKRSHLAKKKVLFRSHMAQWLQFCTNNWA